MSGTYLPALCHECPPLNRLSSRVTSLKARDVSGAVCHHVIAGIVCLAVCRCGSCHLSDWQGGPGAAAVRRPAARGATVAVQTEAAVRTSAAQLAVRGQNWPHLPAAGPAADAPHMEVLQPLVLAIISCPFPAARNLPIHMS